MTLGKYQSDKYGIHKTHTRDGWAGCWIISAYHNSDLNPQTWLCDTLDEKEKKKNQAKMWTFRKTGRKMLDEYNLISTLQNSTFIPH